MDDQTNHTIPIGDLESLRKLFEDNVSNTSENSMGWLNSVKDKLYSMFQCPLKDEFNREAFKWVANLCLSFEDFSWLCSCNDGKWTLDEAKVFSLIARLSINELTILLPLIQRHLTCGDEPEIEDGKVLARSANHSDYESFGDHLVVLESTIKSLLKGQNRDADDNEDEDDYALANVMDKNELKSLLEQLKDIISEICEYLEIVHRYWSKIENKLDTEKFLAAEGGIRIISVWLSEEPFGYESQCKRFLIDLILKNLLLVDRPVNHDLLILGLHSICTQCDDLNQELKRNPVHMVALQKYLNFVQQEQNCPDRGNNVSDTARRKEKRLKMFKLRCGLIKDILTTS